MLLVRTETESIITTVLLVKEDAQSWEGVLWGEIEKNGEVAIKWGKIASRVGGVQTCGTGQA